MYCSVTLEQQVLGSHFEGRLEVTLEVLWDYFEGTLGSSILLLGNIMCPFGCTHVSYYMSFDYLNGSLVKK